MDGSGGAGKRHLTFDAAALSAVSVFCFGVRRLVAPFAPDSVPPKVSAKNSASG